MVKHVRALGTRASVENVYSILECIETILGIAKRDQKVDEADEGVGGAFLGGFFDAAKNTVQPSADQSIDAVARRNLAETTTSSRTQSSEDHPNQRFRGNGILVGNGNAHHVSRNGDVSTEQMSVDKVRHLSLVTRGAHFVNDVKNCRIKNRLVRKTMRSGSGIGARLVVVKFKEECDVRNAQQLAEDFSQSRLDVSVAHDRFRESDVAFVNVLCVALVANSRRGSVEVDRDFVEAGDLESEIETGGTSDDSGVARVETLQKLLTTWAGIVAWALHHERQQVRVDDTIILCKLESSANRQLLLLLLLLLNGVGAMMIIIIITALLLKLMDKLQCSSLALGNLAIENSFLFGIRESSDNAGGNINRRLASHNRLLLAERDGLLRDSRWELLIEFNGADRAAVVLVFVLGHFEFFLSTRLVVDESNKQSTRK